MQPYSQLTATLAITKASLKAIFRSPSAVIFGFAFPLIFILAFGFLGKTGTNIFKIVLDKQADTTNAFYAALKENPAISIVSFPTDEALRENLVKGKITGILTIKKNTTTTAPAYFYTFKSTSASVDKYPQFLSLLENVSNKIATSYERLPAYASIGEKPAIETVREYKDIDFILPGQLGFSLLSAAVFGVAFMFFNLRNTLVLKRFFATPISRTNIILGEGLSRVLFQLLTAIVIILIGHFFFGFTLIHGALTFVELLVLSFLALLVFMGFGFIVSGIAKTESTIPPFANIITLPQFLLAGTFFPIERFPGWLQPLCKILPLTHLNDAMRKIAFEGAHLTDCGLQIGVLILWGIAGYTVAVKVFKWE